jgi:hypothetical protein
MISKSPALAIFAATVASAPAHAAVKISSAATQNMSCSEGVCTPSAANAVLNVGDVETMLAAGDLTIETAGSGGVQAKDIVVDATLSWSNQSGLTLDAYRSIAVNQAVSVDGITVLDLTTNDGGTDGTLNFGKKGSVTFANLGSGLTINGVSYVIENTIASLASAIAANPPGAYAFAANYDARDSATRFQVCRSTTRLPLTTSAFLHMWASPESLGMYVWPM